MIKQNERNHENVDFLTSLYNRRFCIEYINSLIKEDTPFSVFIIDLNRFKQINDVYGHNIGDIVLMEVGKRLKEMENEDILFARLGGDEFAAVYKTEDAHEINHLGEEINNKLQEHILVNESEFTISASIGVSRYPTDSTRTSELLKLADIAMYHFKKNDVQHKYLISDELNKTLKERKKIEILLKDIDIEKDLFLEYQPIFNFENDELIGMEALVRWRHREEGTIYPLSFIPVAEEVDVVKNITRWTFINSLHQIKEWNEKYNKNLKISINVSNHCVHNNIFFGNLQFMLENFKIKSEWLSIELKELSLLISPEYMKRLLVSISDLGVEIHLDDFGTSPIMLSSLRDFKISTIKIDNKFISSLDKEDSKNFVKGITLLAHELGIKISAEGVETKDQYEMLKENHCDSFQGFYKSYPLSKDEFENKYLK